MSDTELDLEEAERAVRLELARVIERGIKADIGEYAVREALPYIIDALADQLEEADCSVTTAPCFCNAALRLRAMAVDAR